MKDNAVENENLYQTPKSEITANEKFNFFGGWLRVFQIINIISIAMFGLVLALMVLGSAFDFLEEISTIELASLIIELLPDLVISIMMVKLLTVRNTHIPKLMVKYLGFYVGVTIVVYIILYSLYKAEHILEKPTTFWGSVIYYSIWNAYFKRSKRVNIFYGANSE